jgi:PAS domain S-box-containing protein
MESNRLTGPDLGEYEGLARFFENAAMALNRVSQDGTILWANAAELRLLGYSHDEYVGHHIAEFHIDETVATDILRHLKSGEELQDYEARLRAKNGTIHYVSITSNVYRTAGRVVHTTFLTRDITEQRRAAELQERLAAIVESSDDAIISKDLNGIIRSWNKGAERIFGYTAEEIVGKPITTLAPPEVADEIPLILDRLRRGERVEHYKTRRRTRDGRILTISLTVSPIRDASGTIIGASKIARDITDQTRASELQQRLAAIVESSDDAIVSKDLNGIIRSWNKGAERIFGYTAEEIIGKPVTTLAAADSISEIPGILDRIRKGERVDHYETKRRTKDGRILTVSLTVSPIRDSSGKVVGASKIARDITDRVRTEQALRDANAALSRANADLEHFAYSASHDLQEPLRMVSAYSEMLRRKFGGQLGAAGDEYINYTIAGAQRMRQLLDDLLAYMHISTENAVAAEVNATEALEQALSNLEAAITSSGASVTYGSLPAVCMHRAQLVQVFQNLIANAVRYRSEAAPKIHVAAERQDGRWLFSVRDNGIGIAPEYKEQIFGMFKRLHSSAEYPGSGMGLAICQRITNRAGGRIWVESERGGGSTFFFTVPTIQKC